MSHKQSRRTLLKTVGVAALAVPTASLSNGIDAESLDQRSRFEGPDTPKICLEAGAAAGRSSEEAAASARRIRQLGVEHVISGGGTIPWEESRLRETMDRIKENGLTLGNLMISGFPNAIYNRPDRDADIDKVVRSIRAAGSSVYGSRPSGTSCVGSLSSAHAVLSFAYAEMLEMKM